MTEEGKKKKKNWHDQHILSLNFGDRLADSVADYMGSWKFIIIQTILVVSWMMINIFAYFLQWDPYPFILLNLLFSTQAAYAAPIIMMSQNRQSDRDRQQALSDYETNIASEKGIELLQLELARIENQKLDEILNLLKLKNTNSTMK